MSSRNEILSAIRKVTIAPRELPSLDENWITYPNPEQHFAETLQGVGGRCVIVRNLAEAEADLRQLAPYTEAKLTYSLVPGLGTSNFNLDEQTDPHSAEQLDFVILPGEFAVAENGAVWVNEQGVRHRVVYFITQHLAFVVPRSALVHNLHQAYQRLTFESAKFGAFISGPSKTADIEQALVIGAHGARSLTVYLVG